MLVAGIGVAAFCLLPRLTVALPVAVAVVGFIASMLGPAPDWPQWALDPSPITHLALVPAEPWAATSGLVITGIGLVLALAGLLAFQRRDLTTARAASPPRNCPHARYLDVDVRSGGPPTARNPSRVPAMPGS